MNFISYGDFNFPFSATAYFSKHFFVWSFQNGALNFDGIMRIFIRIPNMLIFYMSDNIIVSYFYILSIFIFSFFSFYYFVKYFCKIKEKEIIITASLLFVLNPVFLGNIAKIGLILSVSALPLLLMLIKLFFEKQKFQYLVFASILINLSLIHPFTFAVNAGVCFIYLLTKVNINRYFLCKNIHKLIGTLLITIFLNAYFILPILALGNFDKTSLSNDVSVKEVDYTALVSVANTDNMLTAFSLSKNRLKDFDFYIDSTKFLFFSSVFLVYIIILLLYFIYYKKINSSNRKFFVVNLAITLFLLLLSTGTFCSMDKVHNFLISLPIGWSFRSPLKWQLYLPLFICSMLLVVLRYIDNKKIKRYILVFICLTIIGGNIFITKEIYDKLLLPKSITGLSSLDKKIPINSNFLFINESNCNSSINNESDINTELRQILISRDIQTKNIDISDLYLTDILSYDYVVTCEKIKEEDNFRIHKLFLNKNIKILENKKSNPYAIMFSYNNVSSEDYKKNDLARLGSTEIGYDNINPTKKVLHLRSISEPIIVNIKDTFHPDWKLRAGDFSWLRAIIEKSYFLPDDFHIKNNANLNSFKIDPEFIKQNYADSYSENPDGSINLDLTLYFKPQSYFYLGLIISSATLAGCLGYLAYHFTRRNKKVSKGGEKIKK